MSWLYTTLSLIFDNIGNNETGLQFLGSVFLPFLQRGFTLVVLHIKGNLELKERLIILHSGSVNNSTRSFKNLSEISSIPYALLGSIFISLLQISSRLVFLNLKELEGIFRLSSSYFFTEFPLKIFFAVGSFWTSSDASFE